MANRELLRILADNPPVFDELKAFFLEKFEASFNTKDFPPDTTNEVLGQYTRSKAMGCKIIKEAFDEIAQHKSTPQPVDKSNPAY